jgi:hypothetical protein
LARRLKQRRSFRPALLGAVLVREPSPIETWEEDASLDAVLAAQSQAISWCGGVAIDAVVDKPTVAPAVPWCNSRPMDAVLAVQPQTFSVTFTGEFE